MVFLNIHLRGSTIDSYGDYVENIVEDMKMEAEVLEEEDFEEGDKPLKISEKFP